MAHSELVESLKGSSSLTSRRILSEPMKTSRDYGSRLRACELGGAAAIRCQGLSDISAIRSRVEIPCRGLWKTEGVYITPTLRHARACIHAGASINPWITADRPKARW